MGGEECKGGWGEVVGKERARAQTVDVPEEKVLELLVVDCDAEAHRGVAVHSDTAISRALVHTHL